MTSTMNEKNIEFFAEIAEEWWDLDGKFKLLHKFNPVRIKFIVDAIIKHNNINIDSELPLSNLKILDIGCGGGLVSMELAKLGAIVTGIDASDKNINIATAYALKNYPDLQTTFITADLDSFSEKTDILFDVVLSLEVIEHVNNYPLFIERCCQRVLPNGLFFGATINRTLKSLALAKFGAEYVLRWMPIGAHQWSKFVKPQEFITCLENNNIEVTALKGVSYSMLNGKWQLTSDTSMNYLIAGKL